jgi:hypothetical protein
LKSGVLCFRLQTSNFKLGRLLDSPADDGADRAVGLGEDVELAGGVDRELGVRAPFAGDEGPAG